MDVKNERNLIMERLAYYQKRKPNMTTFTCKNPPSVSRFIKYCIDTWGLNPYQAAKLCCMVCYKHCYDSNTPIDGFTNTIIRIIGGTGMSTVTHNDGTQMLIITQEQYSKPTLAFKFECDGRYELFNGSEPDIRFEHERWN